MPYLHRDRISRRIVTGLAVGLALVSGAAVAAPVTYNFVAEVSIINDLDGAPVSGLSLGDTVTGSFTYEAGAALNPALAITRQQLIDDLGWVPVAAGDTPPAGPGAFHAGMADGISESFQAVGGPGFGGGAPVFTIDFDFGSTQASFGGDSLIRHRTNEFVVTPDRPSFAYDTMIAFAGLGGNSSGIRLMDNGVYTGLFPSDQTLLDLPSLDALFLARVFSTMDFDGDGTSDTQVFAQLTSLTRAVPAPGALVLLLLGLLGLRMRVRTT